MNTPVKTWLGVTIIIILALSAGMFIWYQQKNLAVDGQTEIIKPGTKQKACTEEAKICPDGSAVGRTGPNCEFALCPSEASCEGGTCPEIIGIEDKIIITAPAKDSVIASPVAVSGKCRGWWFFEGDFPVDIYDDNGKLLGQHYASFSPSYPEEEWMTENFVNFSGSIKFSKPTADTGYILFKKDNPSDQRELDESFKLPVKFSNTASNGTEEWKTYTDSNCQYEFKYPSQWIKKDSQGGYGDSGTMVYSPETNAEINEILKKGIATEGPAPDISVVCFKDYKNQPNIKQNSYSVADYVKDDINFTVPEKISFAGQSAWRARSAGLYYIYVIIVPAGNSLVEISIGYPIDNTIKSLNDLPEIYSQILSTFKFVD